MKDWSWACIVGFLLAISSSLPSEATEPEKGFGVGQKVRQYWSRVFGVYERQVLEVEVPALTPGFKDQGADCTGFIEGQNQLGPYGKEVVSQIMGISHSPSKSLVARSGENVELGHSDVPARLFLELPEGFFTGPAGRNLCPAFGSMSTAQKLGLWVWIFAALAHDESSCRENAYNRDGTHDEAEGLLQINASYYPSIDDQGNPIYGREARGPGCFGEMDKKVNGEPLPTVLMDYQDNIACGVQIMGNALCGEVFPTANPRPIEQRKTARSYRYRTPNQRCQNKRSLQRLFSRGRSSKMYWAMPRGGHGETDRNWLKCRIVEFSPCGFSREDLKPGECS